MVVTVWPVVAVELVVVSHIIIRQVLTVRSMSGVRQAGAVEPVAVVVRVVQVGAPEVPVLDCLSHSTDMSLIFLR